MSLIKVLPDIVANKIAAGEVVERPASVVKELLENSIDAGATRITVDVEGGGRRLVRVVDNGTGMGREDALLSIERHATSKIESVDDIAKITTLGFRGEALPSIVSVSRAVIDTKRKDDTFGTRLVIQGGVLRDVTDVGLETGTVVEIKSLFYNVPARRKFLRTDTTELKHIKNILYDMAVGSPGLSLSLTSDGREIFAYRGTAERTEMLRQILGGTMTKLMVPFDISIEGVEIEGFLGKPETARNTTVHQYIIMNGRAISSRSIGRAVRDGYGSTIIRGLYPVFVLYVETDPARIDVNVHPTKREIKIHREFAILNALRESVALTIQSMPAAPDLGRERSSFIDYSGSARPVTVYDLGDRWQHEVPRQSDSSAEDSDTQTVLRLARLETTAPPGDFPARPAGVETCYDSPRFWQLKDRYIITTVKEGAIIIDQHIAHERILFEELLEHLKGRQAAAQQLLFPLVLDFPAADYDILEPMIPFLNRIGFGIREFGERSVMVDALPAWHKGGDDGSILAEYIDEMRVHGRITSGYMEKLAAAVACRSAIKAGAPLNQEEMRYLVDKLFATSSPFVCPHGRPVIVKLTIEELDRRFGR